MNHRSWHHSHHVPDASGHTHERGLVIVSEGWQSEWLDTQTTEKTEVRAAAGCLARTDPGSLRGVRPGEPAAQQRPGTGRTGRRRAP